MRRRLLRTILVITVAAVAGFGVPLALSVRARNVDTALLTLAEEASRAAAAVPGSFESEQDPPELPTPGADVDTALYDSAGRRLLGRGPQSDATVSSALAAKSTQRNRNDLVVVYPISFEERGRSRPCQHPAVGCRCKDASNLGRDVSARGGGAHRGRSRFGAEKSESRSTARRSTR